ncbi:hypothetical protein DFH09DRAFT_1301001 [Mycena vulgaris]|nr:hypothetical protein DFH09DRAFT_1301001 [Mycena vulgaris]
MSTAHRDTIPLHVASVGGWKNGPSSSSLSTSISIAPPSSSLEMRGLLRATVELVVALLFVPVSRDAASLILTLSAVDNEFKAENSNSICGSVNVWKLDSMSGSSSFALMISSERLQSRQIFAVTRTGGSAPLLCFPSPMYKAKQSKVRPWVSVFSAIRAALPFATAYSLLISLLKRLRSSSRLPLKTYLSTCRNTFL